MIIGSKSKQALREVASKNNLSVDDLIGPSRKKTLIAARIEAIALMRQRGLSVQRIAIALNRENSTVRYHLSPRMNARKRAYALRRKQECRT